MKNKKLKVYFAELKKLSHEERVKRSKENNRKITAENKKKITEWCQCELGAAFKPRPIDKHKNESEEIVMKRF